MCAVMICCLRLYIQHVYPFIYSKFRYWRPFVSQWYLIRSLSCHAIHSNIVVDFGFLQIASLLLNHLNLICASFYVKTQTVLICGRKAHQSCVSTYSSCHIYWYTSIPIGVDLGLELDPLLQQGREAESQRRSHQSSE